MKNIILSYDYELFFGVKSGTVEKTLIAPTNMLLDAMEQYGLKGNFFVDWQMLKFLKEANTEKTLSDYQQIERQLMDIVKRGHRIELHIHPHWVDAKYNGDGTWDYSNYSHYSLYSFAAKDITAMFEEGAHLLNTIARRVDASYQVIAFRAGGWTVQPFNILREGFIRAGVRIDSSVAIGAYRESPFFKYDFRHVSTSCKSIYRFEDNVTKENKEGSFIEIPISSYHRGYVNKVYDKLFRTIWKKYATPITDGTHKRPDLPPAQGTSVAMVTMSTMCPLSVIRSLRKQNSNLITLIDHPKDYTPSVRWCLWLIGKLYNSITYNELLNNKCKKLV